MNNDVAQIITRIIGKPCSRREVGRMRSLSLGFGDQVQRRTKLGDKCYGEWELGTYRSAWRVVREGIVLCGSQDVADSIEELNLALGQLDLGCFDSLRQIGELDLRIQLDNGVAIDFLTTLSDEDECFHMFCPGELFVQFSIRGGWEIGRSGEPWPQGPSGDSGGGIHRGKGKSRDE
jgi:hypothetical protein